MGLYLGGLVERILVSKVWGLTFNSGGLIIVVSV